jgi:hypothetical protein
MIDINTIARSINLKKAHVKNTLCKKNSWKIVLKGIQSVAYFLSIAKE